MFCTDRLFISLYLGFTAVVCGTFFLKKRKALVLGAIAAALMVR
jgi:hypothetical protein